MSALCMVHRFFLASCCHFVKYKGLLDIVVKLGECPWFVVYIGSFHDHSAYISSRLGVNIFLAY